MLPLSSTWILEFIKLLKDECNEVGQQLDATEADVARLRSGEATPDMIAAGIHVLNASGAIEHPLDANEVLIADIYRAMVRAPSRDAAVYVTVPGVIEPGAELVLKNESNHPIRVVAEAASSRGPSFLLLDVLVGTRCAV